MLVLRNDIQKCSHAAGEYYAGRDCEYPTETVGTHLCSPASSVCGELSYELVVTGGSENETASPLLVDIGNEPRPAATLPYWDQNRRELWFDGILIKRFCQPSQNQELILAAFEKTGWPPSIDDPLPCSPVHNAKRRLNQTIRNLNQFHKANLVHFGGDGTGNRVTWRKIFEKNAHRKS